MKIFQSLVWACLKEVGKMGEREKERESERQREREKESERERRSLDSSDFYGSQ